MKSKRGKRRRIGSEIKGYSPSGRAVYWDYTIVRPVEGELMKTTSWLILLGALVLAPSFVWAEDDLTAKPVPKSTFFSDHSYDNDDVDGTSLKRVPPGSDDLDAPRKTAKETEALEFLDQSQLGSGGVKSPPAKDTEIKPTPAETPSDIPMGF